MEYVRLSIESWGYVLLFFCSPMNSEPSRLEVEQMIDRQWSLFLVAGALTAIFMLLLRRVLRTGVIRYKWWTFRKAENPEAYWFFVTGAFLATALLANLALAALVSKAGFVTWIAN